MRKLLLFSFTALLLFTFFTAGSQTRKEKREARREERREKKERRERGEGEEKDEYDNPEIRDKQAAEQIKDPALGYVPYNRLLPAIDYTEKLKADLRSNRASSFNNLQSTPLTWLERGPIYDSVGPSNGNGRGGGTGSTAGGHTSGRIRAFLLDTLNDPTGNTAFAAGVAGGIWKCTNFLSTINNWTLINDRFDNLAISSICQDPTNPQTIYFSTGEPADNADRVVGAGIWKSTDGGTTFNWLPATGNFIRCFKIGCDAAGNIYIACRTTTVPINQQSGLFRSTNGGANWTDITPNNLDVPNTGTSCTDFEFTSSGILNAMFGYRGVGNKVEHRYTLSPATVTTATWSSSTGFRTSNAAAIRTEMAVSGNILYAVTINPAYNTDSCYKSVNGGVTWTKQNTTVLPAGLGNGQGWYSISLAINPSNTAELICGGLDAYRSTNNGTTWTRLTFWVSTAPYVHADHHYAQYWVASGQTRMIMCTDGGVFYSANNGSTFTSKNRNLGIKQFYSGAIHPTAGSPVLLAGAQDNGTHQLRNPGLSYSIEVTGGDGCIVHINQQNPLIQFGSYVYNDYRRTTNGGTTWSSVTLSSSQGLFVNPFDNDDAQNIMYCSNGPLGNMRRWTNNTAGNTNTTITIGALGAANSITSLKLSPYTSNRLFIGSNTGKIFRIENANTITSATSAANTTDISGASFPVGTIICVNTGTNDNNLVATYSNYGVNNVWVTTDGGTSWSAIDGNLPDMPVRWAMFEPGDNRKIFLATEAGIYTTTNINGAATQWLPETTFPTVSTYMLKIRASDSTIVAGTHGRGLWTAKIPCIPPTINQPSNQVVCNALPTSAVTFTSSDDPVAVYNWTNSDPSIGLAASGTGNLPSFTAVNTGTVPVVATITVNASVGTCTGTTSFTITVNPTPAATISYTGSPYCSNGTTATVTQTGTTGGTYSAAPAGLIINATTGTVTIGSSTPGTYTVTYTIPAAGGCATFTTTTSITITTLPAATIVYSGSPYCSNAGTATVTRTGTAGGTYTSTAGLTINATTGAVTLGTSTPGTYTVSYTIAAGAGCPAVIASTTITITQLPAATISYAGTPYCSTDLTAPVTRTGTAGGTYSSTAGLTINVTTGTVTPNTSTPGTYTVTYTIAATSGCPVVTTTTSITITQAPNATIAYPGTPYCSNAGIATVTQVGTAGGTYSATPAGLSINATTGTVTLGTSTAGTYTVTYTMPASGGCGITITTTTITVTAAPVVTISYAASPYCSNAGTATVTQTGTTGGTYSATPAGLSINATTGAVTLGASTAGTYTVTYSIPAAGGCAAFSTTTTITITTLPAATISYAGTPYCQNAGTANVTRNGTAGGTYSSTAGLTINATTGAVTLGTSTAGTYTVTYTIAAGSGCPVVTATTTITITTLPAATISYAGNPYCQDAGTATVTRTGTAGGAYSSTAGLTINATTGAVTLATSTPGIYTVTYTLAAAGGCPPVTATTSITVNSLSVAPTGATASSTAICGPGTVTLSVTGGSAGSGATWRWYSGSCGGTFVGAGATLNVNVTTTTPYFVRAEGTCNTTACASVTVTVNEQPTIALSATAPTSLFPYQTSTLTATVTPTTGNTITWYRNGNVVAGATGLTLVAGVDALGLYTARATTAAGCTALSNPILIKDSANNRLFITPNPNNGQFRVRYYSGAQQLGFLRHLVMFSENGQKVFDRTFPITGPYSSMNIDARHLSKGFYVVMLTDSFGDKVLATGKVILQ